MLQFVGVPGVEGWQRWVLWWRRSGDLVRLSRCPFLRLFVGCPVPRHGFPLPRGRSFPRSSFFLGPFFFAMVSASPYSNLPLKWTRGKKYTWCNRPNIDHLKGGRCLYRWFMSCWYRREEENLCELKDLVRILIPCPHFFKIVAVRLGRGSGSWGLVALDTSVEEF